MNKLIGSAALVAAAALSMVAAPVSAATLTFDLSDAGTRVNDQTLTFAAGSGADRVNVRATAWSYNGSTLFASRLDSWDRGLGVRNANDNSHTVDNAGWLDFVVFHFDKVVDLDSALLTPFSIAGGPLDSDSSVGRATLNTPWNAGLNDSVWPQLAGSLQHFAGSSSPSTVNLNPSNALGNVWLVGADMSGRDKYADGFKIDALRVTTPATPAVPEPATWAMMIGGFGMVGGAMRRSRRRTRIAFAA